MPARPQPTSQAARIAAHRDTPDTLTMPQLAALLQAIRSLEHCATLLASVRGALQSHGITVTDRHTDHARALLGMAVERIYRLVSEAPDSALDHVREEALGVRAEAARVINA